jgi:hypothetical protein
MVFSEDTARILSSRAVLVKGYTELSGLWSTASVPDRRSDGGTTVKNGVKGWIVVHLQLAVELETAATCEDVGPEGVETGREIGTLFVQHEKPGMVAVLMFGCGAVELLLGVEDLEGEDGEAVDDEAGGLGVEGSGRSFGCELEEGDVDLLGEIVATLVEAIDVVFDLDDGVVGGAGVAGFVFAVPEVVVGLVLVEDKLFEGRAGVWGRDELAMPVRGGLVVKRDDVCGDEHEAVLARITEARRGW